MSPRFLLRLEGALVSLAAVVGYAVLGASWWLFVALLLAPDVFMVGYLKSARLGAAVYNLGHTYAVPIVLGPLAAVLPSLSLGAVALIWTAHIGLDRALGYGLKKPSGFHDTHLSPPPGPSSAPPRPSTTSALAPPAQGKESVPHSA